VSRCRRVTFVLMAAGSLVARSVFAQSPQLATPVSASVASPVSAANAASIVRQYCVGCHNQRTKTAGLSLDLLDLEHVSAAADVWEKAVRKVRVGMMPPQGAPRPDPETRQALVTYLTRGLDRAAAASPNPGRPLIRRLNRVEYANAIHDLLALDVDVSSMLPPDDSAYGFDNNGDALGVSPILLERHLTSASKIAALAVGDEDIGPTAQTFRIRQDASQDTHIEGLPVGTVGGILADVTLPLDGEYNFQARMFRTNLGIMRGLEYAHQLEFSVDGRRVHLISLGGEEDFTASLKNLTKLADDVDARTYFKMRLTAGPHTIAVAFLQRTEAVNSMRLQPFIRSSHDPLDTIGHPHLDTFTLSGPFHPTGPGDTPSRRRILVCRPASHDREDACARRIIATLARRAYRGQSTAVDVERLFSFYRTARKNGTFDKGVQTALRAMLASPKFVFRTERDPAGLAAGTVYRVSEIELASRLSFFLWSSIPDDRLLRIAQQGRLSDRSVLAAEVRRMIADPKADALVSNFAGQWLYLRNLKNFQPNSVEFPDFDDNLRQAMRRETELFFAAIMREDRSALDLMTADFTFLNERLASHYGVPNVYGSQFRRVTLQDDARRGLLGKGAILMVTSHADRTSPVVRGKWILDNLLDAPPPPPPANVPPLNENSQRGGRVLSMRERMEEHRKNPACAGCHKLMDPIGLSMENFDAVGAWRTRDGGTLGTPIDASGELLDGTKVDGIVTLRKALLRQPDLFVGTATEKLMIYALGRGLGPSDMPAVRAIVRDAAQQDYRFSSLILGIVNAVPFRMRIKVEEPNDSELLKTASTR
jgi:mono/diheme cytochrome c family protein